MFIAVSPHRTWRRVEVLKFIVELCFSVIFIPVCFSQSDPPQQSPEPTTLVNVNEVSLNLVVRDKKGKIVSDLKPEDIAVTDGGTAVKLSSLRLVSGDSGEHLVTVVFDRMDSSTAHNAREIAAKVLKAVPQAGFSICVMKTERRLMLYQNFTSDRAALTKAIAEATAVDEPEAANNTAATEKRLISIAKTGNDSSGNRVAAGERTTAQVLLSALQESQRLLEELHTQPGLAGLMALARTEQRIPGRKTVIYFTPGLREDATSEERLRDIVGSANRAGVSIYIINASALTVQADQSLVAMMAIGNARAASAQAGPSPTSTGSGPGTQTVAQPPPGLAPMVSNQMDRYEAADPNANKSPLIGLAENTGGAYVASGGDLKKPLRRLVEDMTTYYEAAYVPPIEKYDGQFRPIAVKPLRTGLKISSRAGYFSLPPDSSHSIRSFEAPLLKVLDQPQLPSDVEFHARVVQLGDMPTGNENAIVIEAPVSALKTKDDPNSNLYSVHVSVVAQIKDKAGVVVEHFGEDIPHHGALDAKDAGQAGSMTMQRHFTAEPGEYVLEAVVLDHNGEKIGAQRLPFSIANPSAGPFLSDVSLVQRIDPVPAEADPTEPLRYGNGKIVPTVLDTIEKGKKELSFFFVVHPDAASTEQPRLEMEILKSGEPITRVPLALRQTSGPAALPYLASIQSAALPSGDYEVIERLSQGGRTTQRSVAFRIAGGESSGAAGSHGAARDESEVAEALTPRPSDGAGGHGLLITSLPETDVPPPTADQLEAIISQARKRALEYGKTLPNFICVEITDRSVDQSGNGSWKHRDSIAEMLTYRDNAESRTTLQLNGKRSALKRTDMNSTWPLSVGEFGAMLNLVFQPSSKTVFEWKGAATLGDGTGTLQILTYRVSRENATIVLSQGNDQAGVGFHGLVYIDATTGGVRRVTLEADGVPHNFAIRAASMNVEYEYVAIGGRDYLLPVRSTVTLQRGRRKLEMNEITFRNYRRFSSRTKIKMQ